MARRWAASRRSPQRESIRWWTAGQGASAGVHTIIKHSKTGQRRPLDVDNRTYNLLLRSLRALGERGFALLTGRWRTLQHITASPRKTGDIVQAALVLTHHEHNQIH